MNVTGERAHEQRCAVPGKVLATEVENQASALLAEGGTVGVTGTDQSYYQRSILAILTSVRDVYGNILEEEEHSFLARLSIGLEVTRVAAAVLSEDAQRLLFRLFLRKAGWLREGRLEYRDIASIRDAACELCAEGLVECTLRDAEDVVSILQLDELRELARDLGIKVTGKAVFFNGNVNASN